MIARSTPSHKALPLVTATAAIAVEKYLKSIKEGGSGAIVGSGGYTS